VAGKQIIVGQIVDCRVQMGTEWTEKLSAERHGVALQPVQGLSSIRRIGFAPNVAGAYHAVNQVSDCGVGDVHAFPLLARVQGFSSGLRNHDVQQGLEVTPVQIVLMREVAPYPIAHRRLPDQLGKQCLSEVTYRCDRHETGEKSRPCVDHVDRGQDVARRLVRR
jgi:hypothetical protein